MHKFFYFAHLKSIFFILHTYFYKTPTSVCLFYTFIQIKYSFLYLYSHRPTPTIHTGITPESTRSIDRKPEKQTQQQDRRTRNQHNPATQSSNPESKQTQQHNPHNPPRIDTFGGDGKNKKQDRCLQRQAVAMARDIQPETH